MELKELRLGNLVYENRIKINEAGLYFTKTTIKHIIEWDVECFDEAVNNKDKFEPIPLDQEWLLKFGAEKSVEFKNFRQYYLDEIKIEIDLTTGEMFWTNKEPGGWKPLKYVHTLQNIYFILSEMGEELTIKEKQP